MKKDVKESEYPTLMSELEEDEKEEQREKERERERENERKQQQEEEENKFKKNLDNRFSSSLKSENGKINGMGKFDDYSNLGRRFSLPYMREKERDKGNDNDGDNDSIKDRKSLSFSSTTGSVRKGGGGGGGLVTQMKRRIEEVKTQAYLSAEKEKKIIEARRKIDEKEKEAQRKIQQANAEKERKRLEAIKKTKEAREKEDLAERENLAFLETQKRMEKVRLMRMSSVKLDEGKKSRSTWEIQRELEKEKEKEKRRVVSGREEVGGGGKARESVSSVDEEMRQTISTVGSVYEHENDHDNDIGFDADGVGGNGQCGGVGGNGQYGGVGGNGQCGGGDSNGGGEGMYGGNNENRGEEEYRREGARIYRGGGVREEYREVDDGEGKISGGDHQDIIPLKEDSPSKFFKTSLKTDIKSDLKSDKSDLISVDSRLRSSLKVSRKLDFDCKSDFDKMSELAYEEQLNLRAKEEHDRNRRNAIFQLSEQKRRFESEKAVEEANERLMRHNREAKRILALQTFKSSEDRRKRKIAADKLILTLADRKAAEDREKRINEEIIRKEKQEIEEAKKAQDEEIAKGIKERKLAREKKRLLHLEAEKARCEENAVKIQAERDRVYKAEWERILKEKAVAVRINSTLDIKRSHSSVSASPRSKTFTFP
jgi:hypothetical protein